MHKKSKSDDLSKKILKVFKNHPKTGLNYKQVAAKLGISDPFERNKVVQKLKELVLQNRLEEITTGKYVLVKKDHYHYGVVDMTSNGNAYVKCDDLDHDIYIPARNLNKAFHEDFVKVYVYKRKKNKKQEGDIIEIVQRAKTEFVGVLQLSKNFGFVVPDDIKMYTDFFISKKDLNGAQNGDKVLVKFTDWPDKSRNPFAEVVTVLGKPGDHQTEMHSILVEYGLPYKFPDGVEAYADKIPVEITKEEISKRRDMRNELTFTIDPKDAKDFDDALSFKILKNGNYEIGIHIADVTHYVRENTILEDEAYQRGTSVYLVDRVVPMLPEILSNNVCSLRPNEEKLTFSAVFELDEKAHVIKQWFGKTVILSDKRFTYEDAQEIIENQTDVQELKDPGKNKAIKTAILKLDQLAKILRKDRMRHGAISFDKTEVKFNLDEHNEPVGVYVKESKDAHKLIEEFMLLANRKVAEFVGKQKNNPQHKGKPKSKTFVYRVHDEPDIDKIAALSALINKFGYQINMKDKKQISNSLNKLLKDVKGKAESNMIETLTIRSMSKAYYTTHNIGHYGLAFDYYTHFTSPIRRYPDMMVHRLLERYLHNGKSVNEDVYEEKCKHASDRETLATRAERDSIKYMQVKYMQDHQDQVFEGVITGVTEWAIYVEIIENKCEGMVRIRDIESDFYIFDEKQYALVGQVTRNLYQLGDKVSVRVKNTDLEKKHLDFILVEDL